MSWLTREKLDALISDAVPNGEFALVHEAALAAWGLDNNLVPYGVDILVSKRRFKELAESLGLGVADHEGNRYLLQDSGWAPLRIWQSVDQGLTYDSRRLIDCKSLNCKCLRPELVLEALPSSPDFLFLLEQRAALAEVLYFDDMTDDQLREFRKYVRSV